MSVTLLEDQTIDGKTVTAGTTIATDVTSEAVLVAHGKAKYFVERKVVSDEVTSVEKKSKGGQ